MEDEDVYVILAANAADKGFVQSVQTNLKQVEIIIFSTQSKQS